MLTNFGHGLFGKVEKPVRHLAREGAEQDKLTGLTNGVLATQVLAEPLRPLQQDFPPSCWVIYASDGLVDRLADDSPVGSREAVSEVKRAWDFAEVNVTGFGDDFRCDRLRFFFHGGGKLGPALAAVSECIVILVPAVGAVFHRPNQPASRTLKIQKPADQLFRCAWRSGPRSQINR
jgi:hypothetical protein